MPVRRVSKDCYRYGDSGKTYCGKGAKAKATKQGQAIKISQKRKEK